MGKASSAKKVARAARAGGKVSGVRERHLMFPSIIGAVVVLGLVLVIAARNEYQEQGGNLRPALGDHWHAAYGVNICGEWIPTAENFPSQLGIHSHGDDAIHIHPTSRSSSGERARLGVFADESPLFDLSDTEISVGEQTWVDGEDTCEVDGEDVPGQVVVAKWDDAFGDERDLSYIRLRDMRFLQDSEAYTIAFVPEGETDIPKPPSTTFLAQLSPQVTQEVCEQLEPEFWPEDITDCSELPTEAEMLGLGGDEETDAEGGEDDEETDAEGEPVGPPAPEGSSDDSES